MGVVNSCISLICIILMRQSIFTRCLCINHLPKHKLVFYQKAKCLEFKKGIKILQSFSPITFSLFLLFLFCISVKRLF